MSHIVAEQAKGSFPETRKRAPLLAATIEQEVVDAGWPVGEHMGFEKDLLERYGVGRALFREAIRIVEQHQVALMRRGPRGGLIVTAPHVSAVTEAMSVYFRYSGTTALQLFEVRAIIEPLAAETAAHRITEDGIERLRHLINAPIPTTALPRELFDPLHAAIAELTNNFALSLFLDVINRLLTQFLAPLLQVGHSPTIEQGRSVHAELAQAIMEGDAVQAGWLARQHVFSMMDGFSDEDLQATAPSSSGQLGVALEGQTGRPASTSQAQNPKMAAVLASRIEDELITSGWPLDHRIGFEPELIETYGVSRAVFRETVRVLEHHGVARMKMGPSGGLVVTKPSPSLASQATALLLEYHHVQAEEVRELRMALELGCLDLALAKGLSPADITSLTDATPDSRINEDPDVGMCNGLHLQLAELTGNPALQVFSSSLMSLWRFRAKNFYHPRAIDQTAAGVQRIIDEHAGIVSALATNDRPVARRRMITHIDHTGGSYQPRQLQVPDIGSLRESS